MQETFQGRFFEFLETQHQGKRPLSEIIAGLLDTSRNSVYRKMRGEIKLTLEEMSILSNHFRMDLNGVLYGENQQEMLVRRPMAISSFSEMENYLKQTTASLEMLSKAPDVEMYYAARDLPLFHYFQQDDLASFKLSLWLRSQQSENGAGQDFPEIPRSLIEIAKNLGQTYFSLPSIELWTPLTIRNTLYQIAYYHRARFLSTEKARLILDDLKWVVNSAHQRAARRYKSPEHFKGDLFVCKFLMITNGALIQSQASSVAFCALSDIRFMQTTDEMLCEELLTAYKNHMQMGQLISGSAEQDREAFFSNLRDQIQDTITSLEKDS